MKKNPNSTTSGHVFKRIHTGSGSSKLITEILGAATDDGGKKANTVGDLVKIMNMTLSMECSDCGHQWKEDPEVLREEFGDETPMKDVRRPCAKCESIKITAMPVSI